MAMPPTSAHGVGASRRVRRDDRYGRWWSLARRERPRCSRRLPSKQAVRSPQQYENGDHVDEYRAALGQIELEDEIECAEEHRGIVNADYAAQSAHRNRNQKINQIFERVLRIQSQKFGAKASAKRRHTAAESKGNRKQAVDIDAERFRHAAVVDGCANLRANASALEREPDGDHNDQSDQDQENAVGAVLHEAQIDLAYQFGWQLQRLTLRSDQDRERGHKDKNQANRQQHLVELAGTI